MSDSVYNKNAVKAWQESRRVALESFSGVGHRYELVTSVNGIDFINDSKSTDCSSSLQSLELVEKPVTWIVGTSEYDEDYSVFIKQVQYKVVSMIVFGKQSEEKIRQTLGVFADRYIFTEDLDEAFSEALRSTKRGGVVLFSPACTSFDFYSSYRERGNHFRDLVIGLMK